MKQIVTNCETCEPQKSIAWNLPSGAGKKTSVMGEEAGIRTASWGNERFQCRWLRHTVVTLSLLHLKGWFLVCSLKNDFKWHRSCFEETQQESFQNNKNHSKGLGPRKNPQWKAKSGSWCLAASASHLHWTHEGVSAAFEGEFKSAYIWCPYKPCKVTFLTRWWQLMPWRSTDRDFQS